VVKPVDKRLYENYLRKAEEMLDVAQYAIGASKTNAAVVASVHCAINAMDALSVFYFGRRHSGGHEEALGAIKGAVTVGEFNEVAKQFGGLMELKNEAEYQPDLMNGKAGGRRGQESFENLVEGQAKAALGSRYFLQLWQEEGGRQSGRPWTSGLIMNQNTLAEAQLDPSWTSASSEPTLSDGAPCLHHLDTSPVPGCLAA